MVMKTNPLILDLCLQGFDVCSLTWNPTERQALIQLFWGGGDSTFPASSQVMLG